MLLLSIGLSWNYSSPPLRLHMHGLGEITAVTILALLTPLLGFYLQASKLMPVALLALPPVACLQLNMLLSVALPDADGDAAVDKRTWVVLLGRLASARLYLAALGAVYAMLPVLVWAGLPALVAAAACLSLPVAIWQARRIWRGAWLDPTQWASIAFFSVGLLVGASGLIIAAFIWLALA
jgi:1,4-dihydroxy-2-naphthoate octaprenyltransferase